MQGTGAAVVEDDLGLHVVAVEVGERLQRLEVGSPLLHRRSGPSRVRVVDGSLVSTTRAGRSAALRAGWRLRPCGRPGSSRSAPRCGPSRPGQRVGREVRVEVLVHAQDRERVAVARTDVEVLRARRRGAGFAATARMTLTTKSTGMTSSTLSGTPGNSGSSPRPYAMISGSATLKPSIQPGNGCAERALDDRRAHDRQAVPGRGPEFFGGALGERLGQRVDVGPAEALGPGAAVVDESGA